MLTDLLSHGESDAEGFTVVLWNDVRRRGPRSLNTRSFFIPHLSG